MLFGLALGGFRGLGRGWCLALLDIRLGTEFRCVERGVVEMGISGGLKGGLLDLGML